MCIRDRAVAARLLLDAVADLGDAVGRVAVEHHATHHARLVAQQHERVAPQPGLGLGADRLARVREADVEQDVVGPRRWEPRTDDRLGARLVAVSYTHLTLPTSD